MNKHTILNDPTASNWLKDALSTAMQRDIVDAVNDAEALTRVLKTELNNIERENENRMDTFECRGETYTMINQEDNGRVRVRHLATGIRVSLPKAALTCNEHTETESV